MELIIEIPKKFTELHISSFIKKLFPILNTKSDKIVFDLTQLEYVGNQNLLLLTSLWKYLMASNIDFQVKLFKEDFNEINIREAKNIIQLWDVWKVYQILPSNDYLKKYFNIDNNNKVNSLKTKFKIKSDNTFFEKYGITPFTTLNKIENFNDFKILKREIEPIYQLNLVLQQIVSENRCEHPFIHNTLSAIITRELYENFLDHFEQNFFKVRENWAFLSLALKKKLVNYNHAKLKSNFQEEEIPETVNFFKDKKGKYKNEPLIQFSFIDYGKSIISTIKQQYEIDNPDSEIPKASEILKYAFKHNTSKNPISYKLSYIEKVIPRGLFDILSIVKRYNGLVIIRSGKGKIFYDFSDESKNINESCHDFGEEDEEFYGNFITIYIPPISETKKFDYTTIKPQYLLTERKKNEKYISLFEMLDTITTKNHSKAKLYSEGIKYLDETIRSFTNNLIFFDFSGWEFDRRLSKIFIFYMTTTYEINKHKSLVVLNPPPKDFLENINIELIDLLENLVAFQTHPLPFIYFDPNEEDLSIYWTGIYSKKDNFTLNNILLEIPDLRESDFDEFHNISGNIVFQDEYGNVNTNIPEQDRFIRYYKTAYRELEDRTITTVMDKAIDHGQQNSIYICSGNYYTNSYITLDKIILNEFRNRIFSRLLYNRLYRNFPDLKDYIFIGITSMNSRILKSMIDQELISDDKAIFLENYHQNLKEYKDQKRIKRRGKYLLVCELIATGYLTNKIHNELKNYYDSSLDAIGVYIDTIDENSENYLPDELKDKVICLKSDKIDKYTFEELPMRSESKKIIRINPFTNQPILKSIDKTNINTSVLLTLDEFLTDFEDSSIRIKYLDNYSFTQSYYFDLEEVIHFNGNKLLERIFSKIDISIKRNIDLIFYPKNSSVGHIDFDYLTDHILLDHSIPYFEIERFETSEGYKFPHLSNFYEKIASEKKILIIDDTTNSGNSMQQLIDEVIFFDVKEIVVLILLGRISNEKLEFLSRIKKINGSSTEITITILHACHIHIPAYKTLNNPNNEEINWLKSLLRIQNLPLRIQDTAFKIKKEIAHIPIEAYKDDYKYLPWEGVNELSKKKLTQTRNEVGKILGHRFYIENFKYFNDLLLVKEDFNNPEYTKQLEEIISVFLYEPFLFPPFKKLLPDIVIKLERLLNYILFTKQAYKDSEILFYNWEKKYLIHLFFIVFTDEDLLEILDDNYKFERLISFSGSKSNNLDTLNYIFYKLLKYIPLHKNEVEAKAYSGKIKIIIENFIQNNSENVDQVVLREIKYLRSFISSLPSDKKFASLLSNVTQNYAKLKDDREHSHAIRALYDRFTMKLRILESMFYQDLANQLHSDWEKISLFIKDILELSSTYPSFFLTGYNLIEGEAENSLRNIDGFVSENIKSINPKTDVSSIIDKLQKFKLYFLDHEEFEDDATERLHSIFSNITTNDVKSIIIEELEEHNDDLKNVQKVPITYEIHEEKTGELIKINFPLIYFKNVVLRELIKNLEHRSEEIPVEINLRCDNGILILVIKNKIKNGLENKIGGHGLRQINKLNNYPNKKIRYSKIKDGDFFIQTLNFELL